VSLLFLRREVIQRVREHAPVKGQRGLSWEDVSPSEVVRNLFRVLCDVMSHLRAFYDMAIAPPPYLELLFTTHLVIVNARLNLGVIPDVVTDPLNVLH